jgi:LuxR family maltose regulon positive regulatory protein
MKVLSMPRHTRSQLRWSEQAQTYVLSINDQVSTQTLTGDWLEHIPSFSFHSRSGMHYTVRKQRVQRGSSYWYAYRRLHGSIVKRYLGLTVAVTIARLEEIAQVLNCVAQEKCESKVSTPGHKEHPVAIAPDFAWHQELATAQQAPEKDAPRSALLTGTFLAPRFQRPRLPGSLVERPRLLDMLDAALTHPLVLLSASVGWGKTTLLSAWTARHLQRVAWLSLDEQDNDPVRFWMTFIVALRQCDACQSGIGDAALSMLQARHSPTLQTILTTLINELNLLTEDMVLILDDYHVIQEHTLHESLLFLLERLPSSLHLMIASREDPPFALARWRVRGQLVEIRGTELSFSQAETHTFLTQSMGLHLSQADVKLLEARTEGWIAGLQLAALTLQKNDSPSAFLQVLSESDRFLHEYVQEEILSRQPPHLQDFLLRTSVLSRLSAPLCNIVTGRNDSALLLDQVERANLFLQPLNGEWYRYHPLWATAIQREARRRLGEAGVQRLYAQASHWYAEHDSLPEAIEAAFQARDFEQVAVLLERMLAPQHFRKDYVGLRRWLERLPEALLSAHPLLSFAYAESLIFTSQRRDPGTRTRIEQPLAMAERGFRTQKDMSRLAQVLSLRATTALFQHELPTAFALAHETLRLQPEEEQHWRGSSLMLLAIEELLAGRPGSARLKALEARVAYEADQSLPGEYAVLWILGEIEAGQGNLSQASQWYQQLLRATKQEAGDLAQFQLTTVNGDRETFFIRLALHGLAQLAYERNELDTAEQLLSQAQALNAGQTEELRFLTDGPLLLARIFQARGQTLQAQELLGRLAAQARSPQFLREVQAHQARIALATGDLVGAQAWSRRAAEDLALYHVRREEEAFLQVRLSIARAESTRARQILASWKTDTQERQRSLFELQLLEALADAAAGQQAEASRIVLHVLTQTRSEGYQRLFLDEGQPLETLLKAVASKIQDLALATYVRTLLHAFAFKQRVPGAEGGLLQAGLLSPQEQRVLPYLCAGNTYDEIAQALIVSPNTIKTQVSSIYRKLGVNRRAEAVALAQQLHLL